MCAFWPQLFRVSSEVPSPDKPVYFCLERRSTPWLFSALSIALLGSADLYFINGFAHDIMAVQEDIDKQVSPWFMAWLREFLDVLSIPKNPFASQDVKYASNLNKIGGQG